MMHACLLCFFLITALLAGWIGYFFAKNNPTPMSQKIQSDYFKGLNYLINQQPDKAVDIFVKLLEVDSETIEMHLALGSLFRKRGEVDRAIRIHQNLMARPQLAKPYRLQAILALGQDYLSAGVMDRAEQLFSELVKMSAQKQESLMFLLHIYQKEKEWLMAISVAKQLLELGEPVRDIIAHYYCELAEVMIDQENITEALKYLKYAQSATHHSIRANIIKARIETSQARYKNSIDCYKKVISQDPDYIPEVLDALTDCYQKINEQDSLFHYLMDCLKKFPKTALVLSISDYLKTYKGEDAAMKFIAQNIQRQPSLYGLSQLIALYLLNASPETHEKLSILKHLLNQLLVDRPIYRCIHCGFSGRILHWLCPSCQSWSTMKPIQTLEKTV